MNPFSSHGPVIVSSAGSGPFQSSGPIGVSDVNSGYVSYTSSQSLTISQQAQARENIDVNAASFIFEPYGKVNGPLAPSFIADTGQPMTAFTYVTGGSAPLNISSGVIAHTPYSGPNSAGYVQAKLNKRISRIGCMASWPTSALGNIALVIPSAEWSNTALPNAGIHLVIYGNGLWTMGRWVSGVGVTTIASSATHGQWSPVWGNGMQPFEIALNYKNGKAVIFWPDGTQTAITSTYFTSETADYAIWELYEGNGTSTVPATLGTLWADSYDKGMASGSVKLDRLSVDNPACSTTNTASGAVTLDFSTTTKKVMTLNGNITSLVFTNAKNKSTLHYVEFIQDATGSRTLAGINSYIKFAGGAVTLTTTPGKRDIFQFRYDGTNWVEVSRSINV